MIGGLKTSSLPSRTDVRHQVELVQVIQGRGRSTKWQWRCPCGAEGPLQARAQAIRGGGEHYDGTA